MKVMVEISLYPLVDQYIAPIKDFIERINTYPDLIIYTSSTSTQITGEYQEVISILGKEMQYTHEQVGQAIFVTKFLNFDAMKTRDSEATE